MIDLETLKSLVQLMVENDLAELDVRDGEEVVKLRRGVAQQMLDAAQPSQQPPAPAPHPSSAPPAPQGQARSAAAKEADEGLETIDSPMVGTFYAKPNPDNPAFVKVGDRVNPDSVVCLIEAMKVFTEVKAETSGVIEKILVKDSDAVEFGQSLFQVRPD